MDAAFGCEVSESLLLGTAQRIVELGMRDAGYYYVCFLRERTENKPLTRR